MGGLTLSRRRFVASPVIAASVLVFAGVAPGISAASTKAAGPPQIVRVAFPEPATTLDLTRTTDSVPLIVVNLIAGTLTDANATDTGVVPGLAQKWTVSSNGLVYTFSLRPNLKFSDGTPLTATDVVATFNTQRQDKANANIADFAYWAGVSAPNPNTVVIRLTHPQTALLDLLAAPWHAVFPASAASKGEAFFNDPISDGPYEVQSLLASGTKETLVVNPNYWGPHPVIPTFQFTDVED